MLFIQEYILAFTLALLILGWWVHNWTVLARLTRIKQRRITLEWFIRNRPYKLRISAVMSLVSGFIAFIWFDPESMDVTVKAGRESLSIYMGAIFGVGSGSDFIVDKVGSKATVARHTHDEPEQDDGKSLMPTTEEREKIIKEMMDAEEK